MGNGYKYKYRGILFEYHFVGNIEGKFKVCLSYYGRLLSGITIMAVYQNFMWSNNKMTLIVWTDVSFMR